MDCAVFEHSPSMEDMSSQNEMQVEWEQLLEEIGGTALLAG